MGCALRLGIDTGKGVVVLTAAATVEAGSAYRVAGQRTLSAEGVPCRATTAILLDGDEVVAAGRLSKRAAAVAAEGDYRADASEPTLDALGEPSATPAAAR